MTIRNYPGQPGITIADIEAAADAAVKPEDLARARIGALDFEWQITGNPLALWEMYAEARAAGIEQHSSVRRYLDEVAAKLIAEVQPDEWREYVVDALQMLRRPPDGGKPVARSPFTRRRDFEKLERGYETFCRMQTPEAGLLPLSRKQVLERAAAEVGVGPDDLEHYLRERANEQLITQRKTGRPK